MARSKRFRGTSTPKEVQNAPRIMHDALTNARLNVTSAIINADGSPLAPGGRVPSGSLQEKDKPAGEPAAGVTGRKIFRAAVFVDGFNLYHAIDDQQKNHLKWLNLRRLAERLIDNSTEELVKVVWCSAEPKDNDKLGRHQSYQRALRSADVHILLGHFIREPIRCQAECRQDFRKPCEKEGDVNLAISAVADGINDLYDVCYIVTADTDHIATAKYIRETLGKKVIVVFPPILKDVREHSSALLDHCDGHRIITPKAIDECRFEEEIVVVGHKRIICPPSYRKNPVARSGKPFIVANQKRRKFESFNPKKSA